MQLFFTLRYKLKKRNSACRICVHLKYLKFWTYLGDKTFRHTYFPLFLEQLLQDFAMFSFSEFVPYYCLCEIEEIPLSRTDSALKSTDNMFKPAMTFQRLLKNKIFVRRGSGALWFIVNNTLTIQFKFVLSLTLSLSLSKEKGKPP